LKKPIEEHNSILFAWLKDWQIEQGWKSVIVIRWLCVEKVIAQRIKGTPGITG